MTGPVGYGMDRRIKAREWSGGSGGGFQDQRGVGKEGDLSGKNKEVFDAEVFVIMQAVRLLEKRGERGRDYAIFSDS